MTQAKTKRNVPASFRDPSGFLFYRDGLLYRQINIGYKENYDHLMNCGLYETLVDAELLIPHKEVDIEGEKPRKGYKIIEPERLSFISYPYEWGFSQLKNAALVTLEIQKKAFGFGMSLKDSSAYNIQFKNRNPVLIDTLSFEKYREGRPWTPYRQFCQHFLAPLALMGYRDIRLNQLFRIYMDGIPLDLANLLLPFRTRFRFSLFPHIHLHAKSQKYFADKSVNTSKHKMSRLSFLALIDSLECAIRRLKYRPGKTHWIKYYEDTNYSSRALQHKKQIVAGFLDKICPKSVWDFGANVGIFSRIASGKGIQTVSFDIDPACVEKNYLECVKNDETNILPLLLDVTNPSPAIGWENRERMSLSERGPAETAMALALIHHLAISNNLPFDKIADFFNKICKSLIIEFIPKDDSMARRLSPTREDIFPDYTQQAFENTFGKYFTIQNSTKIKDSKRTLYLFLRK